MRNALIILLFAAAGLCVTTTSRAQDIEPRQYSPTPIGVNFLVGGYAYTQGGVPTDTALPLRKPQLDTSTAVLAFARSLDFWGRSGKFDAIVPYSWLSGSADYMGEKLDRRVNGFGDPLFRVSAILHGAPAMSLEEFKSFHQDLIVGTALQVSVPLGQYDPTRLVNLGTNRWFFKPSLGVSQAFGSWILELTGAVTLFTDNHDFYDGHTRSQDPLYSLQWHVIRGFGAGVWASLDGTFFAGGSTTIDGEARHDLQRNWRVGGTFVMPVNRRNSIKLYASDGVSARTGNEYSLFGLAWQYRWGGGI